MTQHITHSASGGGETGWLLVGGLALLAWATGVGLMAGRGLFLIAPGQQPIAILLAAILPPLLFVGAYRLSAALRAWVAGLDLLLVTATQAWRVLGGAFLVVWAMGDLPGVFALPAGLGDMGVGVFAVWVVLSVHRRTPGWKTQSSALIIAGMADFAVAFSLGVLTSSGQALAFASQPSSSLLQVLPLALIPGFAVPLFIILHIIAWIRLRQEN